MKVVYAHTVDGLFYRALKNKVPGELKVELKGLGLDLDQKAKDLPQESWVKVLAATVRHLYPRLSADEGYYALGETLMAGYEQTVMGKALFAMMRLLGPLRTLKRLTDNLRSGNSYSEGRYEEVGPNRYRLWCNECNGNPNYIRAVVSGALQRSGAKGLQMTVTSFDGHEANFDLSWQ